MASSRASARASHSTSDRTHSKEMDMASSRMMALALLALAVAGPPVIQGDCGPCTNTICVREPEKVTQVKTVYRCKTKTICLPYCGGKHCGSCESGECGKTRQVRVLVKRFVKEDRCETPCKPKEACTGAARASRPPLTKGK